jgi:hypothetical protein
MLKNQLKSNSCYLRDSGDCFIYYNYPQNDTTNKISHFIFLNPNDNNLLHHEVSLKLFHKHINAWILNISTNKSVILPFEYNPAELFPSHHFKFILQYCKYGVNSKGNIYFNLTVIVHPNTEFLPSGAMCNMSKLCTRPTQQIQYTDQLLEINYELLTPEAIHYINRQLLCIIFQFGNFVNGCPIKDVFMDPCTTVQKPTLNIWLPTYMAGNQMNGDHHIYRCDQCPDKGKFTHKFNSIGSSLTVACCETHFDNVLESISRLRFDKTELRTPGRHLHSPLLKYFFLNNPEAGRHSLFQPLHSKYNNLHLRHFHVAHPNKPHFPQFIQSTYASNGLESKIKHIPPNDPKDGVRQHNQIINQLTSHKSRLPNDMKQTAIDKLYRDCLHDHSLIDKFTPYGEYTPDSNSKDIVTIELTDIGGSCSVLKDKDNQIHWRFRLQYKLTDKTPAWLDCADSGIPFYDNFRGGNYHPDSTRLIQHTCTIEGADATYLLKVVWCNVLLAVNTTDKASRIEARGFNFSLVSDCNELSQHDTMWEIIVDEDATKKTYPRPTAVLVLKEEQSNHFYCASKNVRSFKQHNHSNMERNRQPTSLYKFDQFSAFVECYSNEINVDLFINKNTIRNSFSVDHPVPRSPKPSCYRNVLFQLEQLPSLKNLCIRALRIYVHGCNHPHDKKAHGYKNIFTTKCGSCATSTSHSLNNLTPIMEPCLHCHFNCGLTTAHDGLIMPWCNVTNSQRLERLFQDSVKKSRQGWCYFKTLFDIIQRQWLLDDHLFNSNFTHSPCFLVKPSTLTALHHSTAHVNLWVPTHSSSSATCVHPIQKLASFSWY